MKDYPETGSSELSGISWAISRLDALTSRMDLLSTTIFRGTMANIIIVILITSVGRSFHRLWVDVIGPDLIVVLQVVVLALPLMLVINSIARYDAVRKEGEAVLSEVSDELAWHIKRGVADEAAARPGDAPDIRIRLVMRRFVRSTDLPLTSTRNGPILYVGFNVAITFVGVMLTYLPSILSYLS